MNKTLRILVKGFVQGVGYRFFVRNLVFKKKLNGYVKNLPTGDVEVVLQGEEEIIDKILPELKKGPSGCYVKSLQIENLSGTEHNFTDFNIRFN